jgi:hypothetical protein
LQPRVAATLGKLVKKKDTTLKALARRAPLRSYSQRFQRFNCHILLGPKVVAKRSNLGLELANAFGVLVNAERTVCLVNAERTVCLVNGERTMCFVNAERTVCLGQRRTHRMFASTRNGTICLRQRLRH